MPLYWTFTLLKLALFWLVPATLASYHFRLWNALAAFLFIPAVNYVGAPEPPLVVGWTLSYEMLFYGFVILALALRRPLLAWCTALIALSSLIGLVIPHRWRGATYLFSPLEIEFLAACSSPPPSIAFSER